MIMKDSAPFPGAKVFAIMKAPVRGAAGALGMLAVAWPLAWAPGWTYVVAVAGAAAVLAGVIARWRRGPVLAVAAAVTACAFSRAGTAVLAAEGLFILVYLLAADAPAALSRPGRWVRHQGFLAVAGLIASGAVLAALALRQVSSVWLTVAGLAAVVAAYLVALPSARSSARASARSSAQPSVRPSVGPSARTPRRVPEQDSDVDVE
jgi:hypothetical protein